MRSKSIVIFFVLLFLAALVLLDRVRSARAAAARSPIVTGTQTKNVSDTLLDSAATNTAATSKLPKAGGEKKPQNPTPASGKTGQADQSESAQQRSPKVEEAEHHDVSPPLISIPPAPRQAGYRVHDHERLPRPSNPNRDAADPVLQRQASPAVAPVTSFNFDGIGQGFSGPAGTFAVNSAPPDTNGDVGPNHYVQIVNTDFAIFNKSGTVLYGPVPINTLWSGFGGGCQTNNDGDPVVVYDPIADRWVISQFSVKTTPYLQCVAVSQTGDPTGAYNRYSFNYGNTDFPDYPKMGVWPDAYYITFNIFANGSTFTGSKVCAYNRTAMLAGAAATQQCFMTSNQFGGLLPSDLDGVRQPPAGSPNYIVGLGAVGNQLAYWKFHVDWTTPANTTFTGPSTLATANFSEACSGGGTCIPQSGTSRTLDSLADRLMFRLAYRNFGDHEALVVNHSVTAGTSTGVRWYELRPAGGSLSLFQQGTFAPDSNYRWMGSIAMDQSGNMGLGFSVSGSSIHPQIHYTGRLAISPAGQMDQGEASIIDGAGSQIGSLSRWGDYSMMAVDPTDDCTFWYTTEYIPSDGSFNWRTRIASFKFPGCGTPSNDFSMSANPTSISAAQGSSGTSTISTAVTNGSAQTVSFAASGLPAGATASFNPSSLTAGNSSTLTLTAGASTPVGTYTVTVTGTGALATHSTSVTFIVTSANDFSISTSPTSLSIAPGGSGMTTISTAVTSGNSQTVSLSISGVPSGATASFNPTSITAGGSSTLTINAGTATASTYTLTVTGTGPYATHSASVTLTVTNQPGETVWVEDAPPTGATVTGDEPWNWISANPAPFSGTLAHQSSIIGGEHQHYFYNATATLTVNTGDKLIAYVYIDPSNLPSEVMLQWNDGTWEHRAYWGANSIAWGVNGTNSRRFMGPVPAAGQWLRLEVPASQVGLEGRTLNGMAFTLFGGRATWDHAGKSFP